MKNEDWIDKAAEEFADKEYMTNQYERDALYKGYYHGMKDALSKQEKVIAQEEIEKAWQDYAEEIGLPDSLNYATRPMIEIAIKQAFKSGANFSLSKQEKDADTVIQGWMARDKDGEIYLYEGKPVQCSDEWAGRLHPEFDFQKLRWTSDPIEVEIIIKRKKK